MNKQFNSILQIIMVIILTASSLFSLQKNNIISSNFENKYSELFNQGEIFRINGDFEKSLVYFEKSLDLARKKGSEKYEIDSLLKIALLSWNLGQLKESADYYSKALLIAQKLSLKETEEGCLQALNIYKLYNEAKEYRSSGNYQKSLESFQQAIDLARKIKSPEHELKCLRQMSLTYWEKNNFQEFFSLNKKALKIAENIKHLKEKGNCLNNIGIFYWKSDNYTEALKYYENALEIAQKIKNVQNESEILNNIAIIYIKIGNYENALLYLEKALKIDQQFFGDDYISIKFNNMGTILRKKGLLSNNKEDFHKALRYFNDSIKLVKKIKDKKTEIRVINNIGTVYSDLENYSEALRYFQQGLKAAQDNKDIDILSMILNNIGIVYLNIGNYEESTKYFQRAINLALEIKEGQVLWEAYLELANAYKKQKLFDEALKNYKNSISVIEDIRSTIDLEEHKASYLGTDKRLEAYQNMMDLLIKLHQANPKKTYDVEAFNYLERAKARAFLDSLEVSEIDINQGVDIRLLNEETQILKEITALYKKLLSPELTPGQKDEINENIKSFEGQFEKLKREVRTASPAYANLKYPEIITLEEARELINEHTAFLAYSIGKESSYAFSITKNNIKIFPFSPSKEIQVKVSEYLKAISEKESQVFDLGYELYEELIRPGLDKNIKKIIFVPDDILYFLPFEALLTRREKNSWLIKDCMVAYIPSLSSLREITRRQDLQKTKPKKNLLAFGDPFYGVYEASNQNNSNDIFQNFYATSAFKFYRLRFSGLEIEKIASHFKKKKMDIFLRERATEKELKKNNLADYRILHFAVHGLIDEKKPARSALVLSLNSDSTEDGFVQMREIYNLKINSDLVTLSSCQTGLGQFIKGEGIEGLNRAFFYAGASSVLMSLWAVNDEASYQLMERFYCHLRSSRSIMEALQKAKLEMINSQALSHPYFWAGFVVTGNADKIIFPKKLNKWLVLAFALIFIGLILFGARNLKRRRIFQRSSYRVSQD